MVGQQVRVAHKRTPVLTSLIRGRLLRDYLFILAGQLAVGRKMQLHCQRVTKAGQIIRQQTLFGWVTPLMDGTQQ